jgi:hypothetical protein
MPAKLVPIEDDEIMNTFKPVLREYRDDLFRSGAVIVALFAFSEEEGKPPMKSRGQRVLGKCRVTTDEERAAGGPDAIITLDGGAWIGMSEPTRRALIHHELCHIAPVSGPHLPGVRPTLKARNADFYFDGFHEVMIAHGPAAIESRNIAAVAESHGQTVFPFMKTDADADADAPKTRGKTRGKAPIAAATTEGAAS